MKKSISKLLKIVAVSTILFGVVTPVLMTSPTIVLAKGGGGHSSGGHSSGSHSSSANSRAGSNPASRGGSNPATRSGSNPATRSGSNPATRSGSNPSTRAGSNPSTRSGSNPSTYANSNPAARSSISRAAMSAYSGFNVNKSYNSPNSYVYNPYMNNNLFFYNYYLYSSLWNISEQSTIKASGIDQEKLLHPAEPTYWVTVTREKGEPVKVLVTKSQFDKININDKIEVAKRVLTVNGQQLTK